MRAAPIFSLSYLNWKAWGAKAWSTPMKESRDRPGLISISPTIRRGVTSARRHGNELTLPS